jgi:hypothetical protein
MPAGEISQIEGWRLNPAVKRFWRALMARQDLGRHRPA